MEFRDNQPIYLQIADYACEQILLKNWSLDEKIISIRELAVLIAVNPNTVQRSYDFLQQRNIITNRRGVGYFIEDNAHERIINFRREQFVQNELPAIFRNMYLLKMDIKEFKTLFDQYKKDNF